MTEDLEGTPSAPLVQAQTIDRIVYDPDQQVAPTKGTIFIESPEALKMLEAQRRKVYTSQEDEEKGRHKGPECMEDLIARGVDPETAEAQCYPEGKPERAKADDCDEPCAQRRARLKAEGLIPQGSSTQHGGSPYPEADHMGSPGELEAARAKIAQQEAEIAAKEKELEVYQQAEVTARRKADDAHRISVEKRLTALEGRKKADDDEEDDKPSEDDDEEKSKADEDEEDDKPSEDDEEKASKAKAAKAKSAKIVARAQARVKRAESDLAEAQKDLTARKKGHISATPRPTIKDNRSEGKGPDEADLDDPSRVKGRAMTPAEIASHGSFAGLADDHFQDPK